VARVLSNLGILMVISVVKRDGDEHLGGNTSLLSAFSSPGWNRVKKVEKKQGQHTAQQKSMIDFFRHSYPSIEMKT